MKKLLVWFSVQVLIKVSPASTGKFWHKKIHWNNSIVQAASSQWLLGVHLLQFDNSKNAKYASNGNRYCCCDTTICEDSFARLNPTQCNIECQTYIVVNVNECPYNETCFVYKLFELEDDEDLYPSSNAGFLIQFRESKLTNDVRIKTLLTMT